MIIDGGWSTEHDSAPFCEGCGRLLEGSLTNYGISEEVEHFAAFRFRKMTPIRAFELERIFDRAAYVEDKAALAVIVERTKRALASVTV